MCPYLNKDEILTAFEWGNTDVCEDFGGEYGFSEFGFSRSAIREILDQIPAADVVSVVRCKNCKYGDWDNEAADALVCTRTHDGFWRSGSDFCSFGKPKDKKEN